MALTGASIASGQSLFEKLVNPGPVIEGHVKVEGECAKCHLPGSRQAQSGLCLSCHKPIDADRRQSKGFHGRNRDAAKADCKVCHTDHKGRDAKIVLLDRETFDHKMTNFELKGAHRTTSCNGCHAEKKPYRATPSRCVDCHKAADPHKNRLGDACDKCHNEDVWRQTKTFDHAKTKFPLLGAHQKVVCASCHSGERYTGLAVTCISCHTLQDKHAGKYGPKCETCHTNEKWSTINFDHAKATKFPLRGLHAKAKCDACHIGNLYKDKLPVACSGCHAASDPHKGQLGTKCEQCHKETGWRQKVDFDHDVTRFPLVGLHARVPCEECHRSQRFKDTALACQSCHKDTRHEGRLGASCSLCHNPNGWAFWRFDHAKQTKFALTGAHQGLDCHACHKSKSAGKIQQPGTTCHGCHSGDDVHSGAFGRTCEQCHTTASFKHRAIGR